MVKCRIVMPKHLKEEDKKMIAIMASRHNPDDQITPKDFIAELDAIRKKYGSPELVAWCARQREIYEENRREGRELS